MKRLTVVIITLALLSLACSTQVATAVPTTPTTTPVVTASPTLTTVPTTVRRSVVGMEHVNVRNKPDGNVVGTLLSGDTVTILECLDGWCQIKDPAGYVWQGCLSDNPNHLGCRSK